MRILLNVSVWFYFFFFKKKNVVWILRTPQPLQNIYSNLRSTLSYIIPGTFFEKEKKKTIQTCLSLAENFSISSIVRVHHLCSSSRTSLKSQTKYLGEAFPFLKHMQLIHEYYVHLQLELSWISVDLLEIRGFKCIGFAEFGQVKIDWINEWVEVGESLTRRNVIRAKMSWVKIG